MSTIKYRSVPQAHGAIEPVAGGQCPDISIWLSSKFTRLPDPPAIPDEIGTDGVGPCVGVYFELASTSALINILSIFPLTSLRVSLECFLGHLDTGTVGSTVDRVTALAKYVRDNFYATVQAKFPSETFSGFQHLILIANRGDATSPAIAWGVHEAFQKMLNDSHVFQDPPVITRVSEAQTEWHVGQIAGDAFYAKNRVVKIARPAINFTPVGEYGNSGFTFTVPD
jgi:hypothetical protein